VASLVLAGHDSTGSKFLITGTIGLWLVMFYIRHTGCDDEAKSIGIRYSISKQNISLIDLKHKNTARQLDGKTILITGASYGIGEALTRHMLRYNLHLIIVARSTDLLLKLKEESRQQAAKVTVYTCDFYSEESVRELTAKLRGIPIDYFVSNAGKSIMRSAEESAGRLHDYRRTIAVNYLAPVQLISELLSDFERSHTHIVNVSTYNVLMKTPPKWSAYVSSKKAMHSWFESNKAELATKNITVSTIYFPLIESRMKEANPRYRNVKAMKMDQAVDVIVNALMDRRYTYKPWWHIPAQIGLFFSGPLWDTYWRTKLDRQRY
jgi:short-subunit dehydrogenase